MRQGIEPESTFASSKYAFDKLYFLKKKSYNY